MKCISVPNTLTMAITIVQGQTTNYLKYFRSKQGCPGPRILRFPAVSCHVKRRFQ